MVNVLAVALGGAIGATLRYLMSELVSSQVRSDFPYHTMLVNVLGAFALGVVMTLAVEKSAISHWWRLLLGVGVLGGFTTFSTFTYETLELAREGAMTAAFLNAAGSVIVGLIAVMLGVYVGRLL